VELVGCSVVVVAVAVGPAVAATRWSYVLAIKGERLGPPIPVLLRYEGVSVDQKSDLSVPLVIPLVVPARLQFSFLARHLFRRDILFPLVTRNHLLDLRQAQDFQFSMKLRHVKEDFLLSYFLPLLLLDTEPNEEFAYTDGEAHL
jgi:hypothetical protein